MEIVAFVILVSASAVAGYALLTWTGIDDREAWAVARIVGPTLVVLPAWWLGTMVEGVWPIAVLAAIVAGGLWGGWVLWRRRPWRAVAAPEAVFWAGTASILLLRLGRPAIVETEKLMDLGILTSLMRCVGFPPPDMWLAGSHLPYYYWGSLIWAAPLRLSHLDPAVGYNLVVAAVAGATASGLWALGSRLAGGRLGAGVTAAFFGVLAGTPDGLVQLLSGVSPQGIDLWRSSRQVTGTITEFPLFSFWLGDLHPHVLSLPLAVATIAVAAAVGARKTPAWRGVALVAVLFGITWAANPWAMPPTLIAAGLLLVCGDGVWRWPNREGMPRWAAGVVVAVGGWLVTLPFQLAFNPPSRAIKPVFAWTSPLQLLLYGGALLIPVFIVVVRIAKSWGRDRPGTSTAIVVGCAAVTMIAANASGRPTMVVLSMCFAVIVAAVVEGGVDVDRPALALAMLALFLFLVPEFVYLDDGYGAKLHRMNTVFKTYFQAWMLLSAALPVLLRRAGGNEWGRRVLLAAVIVVSLPHLAATAVTSWAADSHGLDGLRWMDPGDRAISETLRTEGPGAKLVEAVGGAYSRYARLSAASGVPAFLGWGNHEMVWRGRTILPEVDRRREVVKTIYTSGDAATVREAVCSEGMNLVAIGSLERQDFPADGLAAVIAAGDDVIECAENAEIVKFDCARREGSDRP